MGEWKPKISIIVPAYNVERFLAQCLDSVLSQTLEEIEVLCVNDGSTDGTLSILEDYAVKDARLRVIDKANGGYGSAVNRGLDESKADYVAIVEPDDYVSPHMYKDLLACVEQVDGNPADIVKGSFWNYYDSIGDAAAHIAEPGLSKDMPAEIKQCSEDELAVILRCHPSIWSCIYRKAFLLEKHIRMHEEPGAGWVDQPWLYETILQASSVVWCPGAYYYYRMTNPDASAYIKDVNLPFDRMRDIRKIYDELNVVDERYIASLYKRELSGIKRVLEAYGFHENDPEVDGLIQEVLSSIDADVLERSFAEGSSLLCYYQDRMHAHHMTQKEPVECGAPQASIIVAVHNMRPYLWDFLTRLCSQEGPFEVICVDCASTDSSLDVVRQYSTVDGRVQTYGISSGNLAEGRRYGLSQAKGVLVAFLDSRYYVPKGYIDLLIGALDDLADAQLMCDVQAKDRLHDRPASSSFAAAFCDPALHVRFFRRDYLMLHEDLLLADSSLPGCLTALQLVRSASQCKLVESPSFAPIKYFTNVGTHAFSGSVIDFGQTRLGSLANSAGMNKTDGMSDEQKAELHAAVAMSVPADLRDMFRPTYLKDYFSRAQNVLGGDLGILDDSPLQFKNIEAFRFIKRIAMMDYSDYLWERKTEEVTLRNRRIREVKETSHARLIRVRELKETVKKQKNRIGQLESELKDLGSQYENMLDSVNGLSGKGDKAASRIIGKISKRFG